MLVATGVRGGHGGIHAPPLEALQPRSAEAYLFVDAGRGSRTGWVDGRTWVRRASRMRGVESTPTHHWQHVGEVEGGSTGCAGALETASTATAHVRAQAQA